MDPNELIYTKQHQREMLSFAATEREIRRSHQTQTPTHPEVNLRSLLLTAAKAARTFLF